MGNPLVPSDFDALVAARLDEALRVSPLSLRELSRLSGVKLTRLGDVLRRGKAMTVGELQMIASALGLRASAVVREAEDGLGGAGGAAPSSPTLPTPAAGGREREGGRLLPFPERHPRHGVPVVPDEVLARAAASVRPERDREIAETTGWRPDLGEEPQVSPESEED